MHNFMSKKNVITYKSSWYVCTLKCRNLLIKKVSQPVNQYLRNDFVNSRAQTNGSILVCLHRVRNFGDKWYDGI